MKAPSSPVVEQARPIPPSSRRLRSLDGLRGVASLVVLVHHSLLIVPALAAPYYGVPVGSGFTGLLIKTPLHLVWAGTEAVYLFFVLSGLVLAIAARSRSFSWSSYFPSRLVRLYLPVLVAVLLAAAVISTLPRGRDVESMWMARRADHYSVSAMLRDTTLVSGTSGVFSPLWSLQWEVVFSLLLPAFIVGLRRISPVVQILAYMSLSVAGAHWEVNALKYLPMFGIGVALAAAWDRLGEASQRISGTAAAALWTIVVVASLLLASSYWMAIGTISYDAARTLTLAPILLGVTGLVVAAGFAPGLRRLLASKVVVFFGTISFSVYLVHEPLVVAVGSVVPRPIETVALAVPLSIIAATGFYYLVERPSHRLSQRVKRSIHSSETADGAPAGR
jgi:peptidoglycan/LPS O-acetylase OafA/YrhL